MYLAGLGWVTCETKLGAVLQIGCGWLAPRYLLGVPCRQQRNSIVSGGERGCVNETGVGGRR